MPSKNNNRIHNFQVLNRKEENAQRSSSLRLVVAYWIIASIAGAIERVENLCEIGLDIRLVHFGVIDTQYLELEKVSFIL